MQELFERLVAVNIQVLPVSISTRHVAFERDGFIALVERNQNGFGCIGSAGMLTEKGFAALVLKEGRHVFMAKNFEKPAVDDDIQRLRAFQTDLEAALK
jgi:hypothetical protein